MRVLMQSCLILFCKNNTCFVASLLSVITSVTVTVHVQLGHSELFKYGTLSELPHFTQEQGDPLPHPYPTPA